MKTKFKEGDLIKHKASGEKAVVRKVYNDWGENWYILDYSIKETINLTVETVDITFKLIRT